MTTTNRSLIFPLLLVFYEIGSYLSNDMYLPALPNIMRELSITHEEAQLTLTLWFLGSASMQLIMGPLSDRFGRRPVLLYSGIFYVITNCVCALTHDITLLLVTRFIQGITVSAVVVAGYASIHEIYNRTQAIRILAIMGSIIIIAPAFGPLIGSIILHVVSWRWIFWIIALWSMLAIVGLMKWMPESLPIEQRHAIHLKKLGKHYLAIIQNKQFNFLTLTFCFTFCGFIAWLTAGPFIVSSEFKQDVMMFGIYQMLVFGGYVIANRLVDYLSKKWGLDILIRTGMSITLCGGFLAAIFATFFPHLLPGLIAGMMIYSFGSGLSFAPLNRLAIEASKEPMGMRMAVLLSYMTWFGVLGSVLGSVFYNGTLASLAYVLAAVSLFSFLFKYGTVHATQLTFEDK